VAFISLADCGGATLLRLLPSVLLSNEKVKEIGFFVRVSPLKKNKIRAFILTLYAIIDPILLVLLP
jgi:hypothetical protein